MKKIFLIISVSALGFLIACSSGGGQSKEEKKNAELSQAVSKAFETGDTSGIDKVVASDFVDHNERGDMGRDSLKSMITMAKSSAMKMETVKEATSGDYVFTWMTITGTSDGSMGMAPGPFKMSAIQVARCKDGMIVEHWGFMEDREIGKMMQQPVDTSKHM
ncbi:MAG TPA: ester cyclase [Chitinophagaceae bacterium]|nr:ester cyclase [Chitinophagaceae bacterium]